MTLARLSLSGEVVFMFKSLRFDRGDGCMFRTIRPGKAKPAALGSRVLSLLALPVER